MSISAPGIGSGLDIKGIVSQLVSLERRPLEQLQTQASSLQTKLSAFGQVQSQIASLQDQAFRLTNPLTWGGMTFSSSNNAAVSGSAGSAATPGRFSVVVNQLAQAQATATGFIAPNTNLSGTLTIATGSWSGLSADASELDNPSFTRQAGSKDVSVQIAPTDTLAQVASKINNAQAGVTATVLKDASGERLVFQSRETGETGGFRVQASGAGSGSAIDQLAFDPQNATGGTTLTQVARNTQATLNGVTITSTNNRFENAVEGVQFTVAQVTTGPVEITLGRDTATMRSAITGLVEAYNTLARNLGEMTKFDPATRQAGALQGDSTAVGLQNALRRMLGAQIPGGGGFSRLSDIGVEFQLDGTLNINNARLDAALNNPQGLRTLFTEQGTGLGQQLRSFTQGLLNTNGSISSANRNLQSAIERNTREQTRVNERIERTEARLFAQYSRLDTNLASLNAISSYVAQQVTTWNRQRDN